MVYTYIYIYIYIYYIVAFANLSRRWRAQHLLPWGDEVCVCLLAEESLPQSP